MANNDPVDKARVTLRKAEHTFELSANRLQEFSESDPRAFALAKYDAIQGTGTYQRALARWLTVHEVKLDESNPILRAVVSGREALDATENELRNFRATYGNAGCFRNITAEAYRAEETRLVNLRDAAGANLQRGLRQYGDYVRKLDQAEGRGLKAAGAGR